MAINGAAIQAKVKAALAKLNATSEVWKFRQVIHSGGKSRLGLHDSTDVIDIELDTPPAEETVSAEDVANSNGLVIAGDLRLTIAGDVDKETLRTHLMVRGDDVYRIVDYRPFAIDRTVVGWQVIVRMAKANS